MDLSVDKSFMLGFGEVNKKHSCDWLDGLCAVHDSHLLCLSISEMYKSLVRPRYFV